MLSGAAVGLLLISFGLWLRLMSLARRLRMIWGGGFSTLNKWVSAHRDTDVISAEDRDLARENERLRRE